MLEMFWFINALIWPVYVGIAVCFTIAMSIAVLVDRRDQNKYQ